MVESKKAKTIMTALSYLIMGGFALICVLPFVMVLSASFSDESALIASGYSLLPKGFTAAAYQAVFKYPKTLIQAYGLTILTTVLGAGGGAFVTAAAAYPLTRPDYKLGKTVTIFFLITMLFSGGAIPSYLINTKYLHLSNNILVLIIPGMFGAYNCFVMRTYFANIPPQVIEAAKIDGASEFQIFFKIIIPLGMTGIATVGVLMSLTYWNSWYNCMMYMTDGNMITLQYFLHRTMSNIDEILRSQQSGMIVDVSLLPKETTRMAMCVLAAGPMVCIFMFFQRFFVGGINVGSVKG